MKCLVAPFETVVYIPNSLDCSMDASELTIHLDQCEWSYLWLCVCATIYKNNLFFFIDYFVTTDALFSYNLWIKEAREKPIQSTNEEVKEHLNNSNVKEIVYHA